MIICYMTCVNVCCQLSLHFVNIGKPGLTGRNPNRETLNQNNVKLPAVILNMVNNFKMVLTSREKQQQKEQS